MVQGCMFTVDGSGTMVYWLGFMVQGLMFRFQGLGMRVEV